MTMNRLSSPGADLYQPMAAGNPPRGEHLQVLSAEVVLVPKQDRL